MTQASQSSAELLAKLISFDTTSRNSNLELIAFVEDYLKLYKLEPIRIDYEPGKANVFATIGPQRDGGVVLSGHTDVVPVDGQKWSGDPFNMRRQDGLLFGRGTCDMKGFLACCLAAVPELISAALQRPVHLAFSCDEEVSCEGVLPLVQQLGVDLPKPSVCIVGEPTMMDVVTGHKTCQAFNTRVTGIESHSSLPEAGFNAVYEAAQLTCKLQAIAGELRDAAQEDSPFDPPYSTVQVGAIHGGTVVNIVPNDCIVSWEARLLPDADLELVRGRMQTYVEDRNVEIRKNFPDAGLETDNYVNVPGLVPESDGEAKSLAMRLAGSNRTSVVSYASEAGHFQTAGLSTVLCGPGSIEQAHKPDEFVATEQLDKCDAFLTRLTSELRAA